jgi:Protein of unknown function (DUF2771)
VLALIVVVAAAVVVVLAIRDSDERLPQITAYSYGETITVAPAEYCGFDLTDCTQGNLAVLDVPAGQPLQLSLPKEIADAPWRLVMVYQGPEGKLEPQERYYRSGEADAVTVVSDRSPAWQLNGVEIQLPSAVVDENGLPHARAVWAIKTA